MAEENENVVSDRVGRGRARDTTSVPEEAGRRFIPVGQEYYFKDGALAFTDRGRKLVTRSENTEVLRTMVDIAVARKWEHITVSGSEVFRREAWREARSRGLEVRGYAASEVEEARMRMRSEFSQMVARDRAEVSLSVQEPPPDGVGPGGGRPGGIVGTGARAAGSSMPDRPRLPLQDPRNPNAAPLFRGTLVEFGPAKFAFDEEAQPSYFVRIKTFDGPRTIWGKDLERAITNSMSQPQVGDEVGLHPVGRQSVRVRGVERNSEGAVVGEKVKTVQRNQWVVEKLDYFAERAKAAATLRETNVEPAVVMERHPLLRDAYLALKVAELAADKKIALPENRTFFVKEVRERLARILEEGGPLPAVRLRARTRAPEDPRPKHERSENEHTR